MHDGSHVRMGADRAATVEATERLIRRCRDQGYEFVTVTQMIGSTVTRSSARNRDADGTANP